MKVIINDTPIDLNGLAATLELAVQRSGVSDVKGLAVAVNSMVIPRTNWSTFQLNENDIILIIRATQGG